MAEYFIVISAITAIITVYDKLAAKLLPRMRIPEKVLLITGFIGGAAAEFITMKIIRHKTRHKIFMRGLPAMIVLHVIIAGILVYRFYF